MATAAFTGLRAGDSRTYLGSYTPGSEGSLGVIYVLHSVWRGHIGEPMPETRVRRVENMKQLLAAGKVI